MTTKSLDERIAAVLSANDFMMMDVHRPMTDEEIKAVHPQAIVDKSLRLVTNGDGEAPGMGAPHEDEQPEAPRYKGPFVEFPDNVVGLDVCTSHELQVDRILQSAFDNNLASIMVIGIRDEDQELFVLASNPDIASAVLLTERAKMHFMDELKNSRLREAVVDPKEPA